MFLFTVIATDVPTNTLRAFTVVAVALVLAPQALAQSVPDQASEALPVLEEIVVTATRRAVSMQKLPESISAITGPELDDLNAQTFEDYFRTVPGLMVNSTGSGLNRFDFSLRGISSFGSTAPPTSATVGQYYDEIPVTAVGQQIDPRLIDIDRIEVLRGPQGTYFGEDSLGGTIRIISKKPSSSQFSGSAEGRFSGTAHGGTNNSESLMANIPLLADKLALRVNYFNARDSGYINNVPGMGACAAPACNPTEQGIDPSHARGERGLLLFQPIEQVSILAEAIHSESVARNTATYEPAVGDLQIIPQGPDTVLREQDNLYNLTVDADLGAVSLVSSSSWGYRTQNNSTPTVGLTGVAQSAGAIAGTDTFAQEVRLLSGKDWSSRWDYILGAYYSRQTTAQTNYGSSQFGSSGLGSLTKDKAGFGEVGYKLTGKLSARLGIRQQTVEFESSGAPGGVNRFASSGQNKPTTGRVVLNYDLSAADLLYTSVSKGFRKGGLNPYIDSRTGQAIPGIPAVYNPDTTTNYELGWKVNFPSRRATLAAAIYHIDWKDIQVPGVVNIPGGGGQQQYFSNAGAAKVDGLELEGSLELLQGLQARASFSLMNPVISQNEALTPDNSPYYADSYCDRGCPARKGNQIPFVPKVSGSFTLNYRHALGLGGFNGFAVMAEQYTGKRNTGFAPTWTGPSQSNAPCSFSTIGGGGGGGPGGGGGGGGGGGLGGGGTSTCPRTHTGDANPNFRTIMESVQMNLQTGVENAHWRFALFLDNVTDRRNPIFVAPGTAMAPGTAAGPDEWLINQPRTLGIWVRRTFD